MIKQTLYQHILIKRVLFVFIVLRRLNELFSKKEFEHKAEVFTYSPVGNRLTGPKDKLNYTYNQGNQLSELIKQKKEDEEKKREFTYDNNGNLVKRDELDNDGNIKKTILYSYDYENRLVMVVKQDEDETKTVSFKYDSFGRRIEKRVEEIEEGKNKAKIYNYVYDNEDIILEYLTKSEDGKTKTETTRYIHGNGIDEPLAIERKGEIYYYHADGLGSITSLTDKKQKVVESYEYDSFGNMKRKGDKVKNTFTYTGREWDKEIGLNYYRMRYYDPKIGRFIQKDPIGFEGGINFYTYVENNPVNKIDPWGLWTYASEYGTTGAGLTPNITGIENTVDNAFNSIGGRDAIVTFTMNGKHSAFQSRHYTGNAIDLRVKDLSPFQIQQVIEKLRKALGPDYDVINEGTHIHIEYDPKPCKK